MSRQLHVGDDGELQDAIFCVRCGQVNTLQAQRCKSCGAIFVSARPPAVRADRRVYYAAAVAILFICYMLSDRSYHPPVASSIPATVAEVHAIRTSPDTLTDTTTRLVFGETLPNEADLACISHLPQNEPLIAANYADASHNMGVALISSDGKQFCRLTIPRSATSTEYILDKIPHWVSKNQIVFNSTRIDKDTFAIQDAFVINTDGSHFQHINLMSGNASESYEHIFDRPTWSPNGKSIAFFAKDRDYNQFISVINADGTGMRQLTTGENVNRLAWSPDSRWIFFTANSGNDWSIYKLAADGSSLQQIPGPALNDISFAVSPDGKSLVIVGSDPYNGTGLSVINTDVNNRHILLTPVNSAGLTICAASPVWVPETNAILFIAAKMGENCSLYKMNVDGSGIGKFYDGPEALGNLTTYYTN